MTHAALTRIRQVGLIPVIRADAEHTALRIGEALVDAGVSILEITMTVPAAMTVVAALARRFGPSITLGAGTITSSAMADEAVAAGCVFLVTPCLLPEVVVAGHRRDTPVICGALTPTEVLAASLAGADLVKVFPASTVGGPAYIRALRGPFPSIELVATGGISLESVGAYFEAGVVAVGVGGELISRPAVAAQDFAAVGRAARQFTEAVAGARPAADQGVTR